MPRVGLRRKPSGLANALAFKKSIFRWFPMVCKGSPVDRRTTNRQAPLRRSNPRYPTKNRTPPRSKDSRGLPPFFFLGCPPLCLIGRSYRFAARCRFFLASENGLVEKESISPVPAGVTRHLIGTSIACFRGRIMRICDRLRAAANWVSSTIEGGGNSKPKTGDR